MGSPAAAVPVLNSCLADHEVVAVFTQPDRVRGRGGKVSLTPVAAATPEGVRVEKPVSLRKDPAAVELLKSLAPEVIVVAAYGQILPDEVLAIPPHGCVNVHYSLLPRWRGAAPVERAIEAGDPVTGVSIMQMDAGLDTGPVYATAEIPIGPDATAATLTESLAELGAELLARVLDGIDTAVPVPQPSDGVTYASKIDPSERHITFDAPADEVDRRIRALTGSAGAYAVFRDDRLALAGSEVLEQTPQTSAPGQILDQPDLTVACTEGAVRIVEVVPAGKKQMDSRSFMNGYRPAGEFLS